MIVYFLDARFRGHDMTQIACISNPLRNISYVTSMIRERIVSGIYSLGSRLDQKSLADELDVSLIPVRESLRKLAAEGLVRIAPRRGAFVVELSPEELQEVYLMRTRLEELATELCVPHLTPAVLGQVEEILDRSLHAAAAKEYHRLLDLNRDFHFTLYRATGGALLVDTLAGLWDRSRLYRHLYIQYQPQRVSEHVDIFEACKRGDAAAARRLMRLHYERATEDILGNLQQIQAADQSTTNG